MSKSQQRKGRAGELELARLLQDYGYPVEPGQEGRSSGPSSQLRRARE